VGKRPTYCISMHSQPQYIVYKQIVKEHCNQLNPKIELASSHCFLTKFP